MRVSKNTSRTAPSKTVAVFLSWFEPRILKGIARLAREKNWVLLLDYAQVHKWSAIPNKLDGLICLVGPERKPAEFLRKMNVPTVVLGHADEGLMGNKPRVLQNDLACGRLAAEHFLSLGFENFLTIGKKNRTFFRERIKGFTQALGKRANVIQHAWIGESLAHTSLRGPIEEAMKKVPKPMAIFAPSDVTCVHVMQCAQHLGLRVPEDAAILSANNDELICDFAPVPLSSIRLNFTQWGFEAAVLLDKLMNGRAPSQPVPAIPPGSVVSRQSTNILLVPDEQVAQAMRYIWKNLSRSLPIQEIADHLGISHPTLGRLFRKHLRRSVSDEIMLARLDKAKQMLTFQKMPIQDIATACGFNTPNYFNNVFHKATGVTPRKFRMTADPATAISRPDFVSLSPSMAEKK